MKLIRTLVVLTTLLVSSSAFAGVRFGLHYLPTYTLPLGSGQIPGFDLIGGGASVGASFGAKQMFGFEFLGGYVTHTINNVDLRTLRAQIGPHVRFNNYLSVKAFGSMNYQLTPPAAYNTFFWWGAGGGFDIDIPIGNSFAFTTGAQFTYTFTDVATTAATVYPGVVMLQAGLRFGSVRGGK